VSFFRNVGQDSPSLESPEFVFLAMAISKDIYPLVKFYVMCELDHTL